MLYDVIIVGAGASGLVCAYQLAKQKNLRILIIEKESIAGKKLKAAGNGKCNITNQDFSNKHYHSKAQKTLDSFLDCYSYEDVLHVFQELGIACYEQNGYYYPLSNQGKQVVEILFKRCEKKGVQFVFDTILTNLSVTKDSYILETSDTKSLNKSFQCKYVVMATGGCAYPKLGGSELGLSILKKMKVKTTNCYPCLCPIYVDNPDLKIAKGVRVNGNVSIQSLQGERKSEYGQIQLNEDNISGICVMNLSYYYNRWKMENIADCMFIDFFPYMSWDSLKHDFQLHKNQFPSETLLDCLNCYFPQPLSKYIIKKTSLKEENQICDLTEKAMNKLTSGIKKSMLKGTGLLSFDKAQVTGGGISLEEISMHRMECKRYPGLFIIGELLDVNGDCGGYNISFAVISAISAANTIKEDMKEHV